MKTLILHRCAVAQEKTGTFIIRLGIFAVSFHTKPADDVGRPYDRQVYEIVPDAEATTFDNEADANKMALDHGLRKFTVCPIEE